MRKTALINGKVYVERGDFREAIYAEDGVIKFVGSNEAVKAMAGPGAELIDAQGKTVIPGINDAHLHFLFVGIGLSQVNTMGCKSMDELIQRCRDWIEKYPQLCKNGLFSMGYNEDLFTEGEKRSPNRYDLDKISTDIPVILARACGHIGVCNSKTLEMLNVKPGPLPGGGFPVFDDKGEPTGVFNEAVYYLKGVMPTYTAKDYEEMFMLANQHALECGVTSVQSNDLNQIVGKREDLQTAITNVYASGKAKVRYRHQICYYEPSVFEEDCRSGAFWQIAGSANNPRITTGPLKLFGDGSLGGRTATIRGGYKDDPGNMGVPNITPEKMLAFAKVADKYGVQLCTHVIGDQAIEDCIKAYEAVLHYGEKDINPLRHVLMHCQITDREMMDTIRKDDLIPCYQPIFLDYDMHIVESRCGKDLCSTSYAFGTADKLGIHQSFGTDSPVEDLDPFPGLYCAVTRLDKKGWPEGGWNPQECIDVYTAVDAYTVGSAYQEFAENTKGRIKPGYLCDLAVLDTDIFTCDPVAIKDIKCDMTIIDGDVVFERK
ncbi:MAG: amidohydrolase [Clostridia bacterium]|nr:amidohydrolase [Clostridia bacterium]